MTTPLTKLEAAELVGIYRRGCWHDHTFNLSDLATVLAGHQVGPIPAREHGVTEDQAIRALDMFDTNYRRPPTPAELSETLDMVLSSPDAIRSEIANTRQILANAKARRKDDHERLKAESDARREQLSPRRTA